MLEKPDLKDERIITCLQDEYGLSVVQIAFLPLGADQNTAVYRVVADDEMPYFVKLRRGDFDEAAVAVPKFLSDLGIKQIIPSLTTQAGQLWASLDPFNVILYPFVEGHNGFEPVAVELAAFLKTKRNETLELVKRSERFALALQAQPLEFILCHADIHAWNLLIDVNNALYMVDWDTLIFAPKERDLMFVGSGLGGNGHTLQEEEILFYQGYGQTQVNPIAMAYYRYERIIEDIAVYCEQILLSDEGGEDREQSLEYLKSNFLPNGTIEIAYQSDKTLREG
jgi:spectinomycin phosphotransferase